VDNCNWNDLTCFDDCTILKCDRRNYTACVSTIHFRALVRLLCTLVMQSGKTNLDCYSMNPTLFSAFEWFARQADLVFVTVGYVFTVTRGTDHVGEGVKVSVIRHGKECNMNIR